MQSAARIRLLFERLAKDTLINGKIHGVAGVQKFCYGRNDKVRGATTDNDKTEWFMKCDEEWKMSVKRSTGVYGCGERGKPNPKNARKAFYGAYLVIGELFPNRTMKC